jgi:5-methylcytosine-specific restriction endonuclease McrA
VLHWARGGRTALENLVLLCRRHHRLVHSAFHVEMTERGPVFRRGDGTLLEERAPP